MTRALQISLLQLRIYLQDKSDLAFGLILPVAIFALMYGAFGGQTLFHATASVVNEDAGGTYSGILLDRLEDLEGLDVTLLSRAEAEAKLKRSDLLMVVVIPEGFSDRLSFGGRAQLLFWQRGNGGQEGQIVAALVRSIAEDISQGLQVHEQAADALADSNIPVDRIDVTVEKFLDRERRAPLVTVTEETVGSSPDPVNQFLPGIITMFVLFAITLSARALVEERRLGTLERLLTTNLSVGELFSGKFLASVSRGFVQTVILLVLSYAVFQLFTPLSFLECLVIALIFSGAASAIGLVIASVVRTPDQAVWIAVFFTMAMVMVSGTFFTIEEGSVLDTISRISINTHANVAFRTVIAEGGSLADVWPELVIMLGVILGGGLLSRVLFRVVPGGR